MLRRLLASLPLTAACSSRAAAPRTSSGRARRADAGALLRATSDNLARDALGDRRSEAAVDGDATAAARSRARSPPRRRAGCRSSPRPRRSRSDGTTSPRARRGPASRATSTLQGTPYEVPGAARWARSPRATRRRSRTQRRVCSAPSTSRSGCATRATRAWHDVGDAETVKITGAADASAGARRPRAAASRRPERSAFRASAPACPGSTAGPARPRRRSRSLNVTVYTGADDRILRRLVVDGRSTRPGRVRRPRQARRRGAATRAVRIAFDAAGGARAAVSARRTT